MPNLPCGAFLGGFFKGFYDEIVSKIQEGDSLVGELVPIERQESN